MAIAEAVSTGLSGVLERTLTVQASLGATVLATLNRATSLDAFIEGAPVPVAPAAGRTFTVAARPDCTILPDGRVYVIPKGGRVH